MGYFKEICCFVLIAETFIKLCPNEKYEEYLRMITGFICMVLVITPVLLFLKGETTGTMPSLSQFEKELEEVFLESKKQVERELEEKLEEGWKIDEETGIFKR